MTLLSNYEILDRLELSPESSESKFTQTKLLNPVSLSLSLSLSLSVVNLNQPRRESKCRDSNEGGGSTRRQPLQ